MEYIMPNLDGTGPIGHGKMTGGRRGRCRNSVITNNENTGNQTTENNEIVYGIGRGGRQRGAGGFGNRFGGGSGNKFGSGFGKGFGKGFGRR
jgi:hypothetical protein